MLKPALVIAEIFSAVESFEEELKNEDKDM